ncbi:MAG: hypothetical protein B7Z55_20025 [Planctomycetales bacterium 12-60-4]|nr:MAG: hypothetical protein B7Z55_20025 [Planctomycetales bacterium 12-60-4]
MFRQCLSNDRNQTGGLLHRLDSSLVGLFRREGFTKFISTLGRLGNQCCRGGNLVELEGSLRLRDGSGETDDSQG